MRNLVLLRFGHLSICLAVVLEARIPACTCQSGIPMGMNMLHLPKSVGPRHSTILPYTSGQRIHGMEEES